MTDMQVSDIAAAPDDGALTLIRALMLVQIGVIVTATVEAAVLGLASPGLALLPILNASFAVWTMMLLRGVGRLSARSRKWTMRLQVGWIALALVDLLLAVWLADRSLEPVPLLTRMFLPAILLYLLKRPDLTERFS